MLESKEYTDITEDSKREYLRRVESAHSLPDSLCEDSGMDRPNSEWNCGLMECPSWIAPAWASCEYSKCISTNTGMLKIHKSFKYSLFAFSSLRS